MEMTQYSRSRSGDPENMHVYVCSLNFSVCFISPVGSSAACRQAAIPGGRASRRACAGRRGAGAKSAVPVAAESWAENRGAPRQGPLGGLVGFGVTPPGRSLGRGPSRSLGRQGSGPVSSRPRSRRSDALGRAGLRQVAALPCNGRRRPADASRASLEPRAARTRSGGSPLAAVAADGPLRVFAGAGAEARGGAERARFRSDPESEWAAGSRRPGSLATLPREPRRRRRRRRDGEERRGERRATGRELRRARGARGGPRSGSLSAQDAPRQTAARGHGGTEEERAALGGAAGARAGAAAAGRGCRCRSPPCAQQPRAAGSAGRPGRRRGRDERRGGRGREPLRARLAPVGHRRSCRERGSLARAAAAARGQLLELGERGWRLPCWPRRAPGSRRCPPLPGHPRLGPPAHRGIRDQRGEPRAVGGGRERGPAEPARGVRGGGRRVGDAALWQAGLRGDRRARPLLQRRCVARAGGGESPTVTKLRTKIDRLQRLLLQPPGTQTPLAPQVPLGAPGREASLIGSPRGLLRGSFLRGHLCGHFSLHRPTSLMGFLATLFSPIL